MPEPDAIIPGQMSDQKRLRELVERYRTVWEKNGTADVVQFLPPTQDKMRRAALLELIRCDLKLRWARGHEVYLETYLKQFPELGDTLPPMLIIEEYEARRHGEHPPDLEEYHRRFPIQFDVLQRLVSSQGTDQPPTRFRPPDQPSGSALENPELPAASDWATLVPDQLATPVKPLPSLAVPVPPAAAGQGTRPPQSAPVPPSTAPAPPPPGGKWVEGYQLRNRLGSGSFAEVWAAVSPEGYPVALKKLYQALNHETAQRELKSLEDTRQLRHPFLLQTHRFFVSNDHLHIVMELADSTLHERNKECKQQGGVMPLPELLLYMREAAGALDYMHRQQVQHRDIKPSNILLLQGHVKVADFGLSRLMERPLGSVTSAGTPVYMPPEVWQGKVSTHSDQYSLAVMYAELRLGRVPFAATTPFELMTEHVQSQAKLDGLTAAERAVVSRALSKNPEQRFPTCTAFVDALEAALKPPDIVRKEEPPRSRKLLVAGLLTIMAIVGAMLWIFLHPTPRFRIDAREALIVSPGDIRKKSVFVRRVKKGDDFEIRVTLEGLPPGVSADPLIVGPEQKDAYVQLQIMPDAPLVDRQHCTIRAVATDKQGGEATTEFDLTVQRDEDSPFLTLRWQKALEDSDDDELVKVAEKHYFSAIDVFVGPEDDPLPVRFLLVRKGSNVAEKDLPACFYMMRDKVSVGLFKRFDLTRPKLRYPDWEKARNAMGKELNHHPDRDDCPVMAVDVEDAYDFGAWLIPHRGHLPSPAEWDKAAGWYEINDYEKERDNGPFVGTFDPKKNNPPLFGLDREDQLPLPNGLAANDRSSYSHCRDMAANGREWTSEVKLLDLLRTSVTVKASATTQGKRVVLRSQDYKDVEPWRFKNGGPKPEEATSMHDYDSPDPGIGFRVSFLP